MRLYIIIIIFFFTLNNFCHILKIVGKGKENLVKEMEEFRSKLRNKSGQAWQKNMNFNVEIYSSTHVSIFKTFFFFNFSHFSTDDIPFGVKFFLATFPRSQDLLPLNVMSLPL